MFVRYSPVRSDDIIEYSFNGTKITATFQGVSVAYDISDMPYDDEGVMEVERINGIRPVLNVYKENGKYCVELRHHYGENATEEEKFPDWVEV